MNRIYLDNAATTPVRREVFEAMVPYLTDKYGNPSSIHSYGREARADLNRAREQVAAAIGAAPEEIIFTAGGSEADNLAIKGTALAMYGEKSHIITSAVEHHAVLHSVESLKRLGFSVTILPVDSEGMVDPEDVKRAITPETCLISIMYANNEVGTIQPIEEISRIAREAGVLFHTDAVQAVGHMPVDVKSLGVDMLSLSGHKFYGPKGVGALYARRGVRLAPLIDGGAQERKRRAGTENMAGIVGIGMAIELAVSEMDEVSAKEERLRDKLIEGLTQRIPDVRLNGHRRLRLPNNVNMSFLYVEGESLLLNLDMEGIAASSGSACTSGSLAPSHVLMAMGIPHEVAHGSVRMTLGRYTEDADVERVLDVMPRIVEKLRAMSPIYVKTECGIKEFCANAHGCDVAEKR
ncbi:MAG TPA: cysteine desulfurase NifS [Bacillota bacterium]|nr:cysteine desulfurase NifS [Bacillota bacterium]HOB42015.1 cysteine desulfurase NifS [Bacillota bacterium]HOO29628.1 cysteine desulfurase NifS [Bacillota bacterium]HPZ12773.1 cysteine desulfurase NifS [Bacillota bacterium]HQD79831.1 cysteine desulfurase NifS [Bacillota bacterium]